MKYVFKAGVTGLVAFASLAFAAPAVNAAEEGFSPDRTAWKLTIKPEKFEKYIDFPNTQIGSVIRISVFHESMGKGNAKPVHYKNYYYDRDGKALGSKQLQPVTFPPDTRGPILVKEGPNGTDQGIADATASVAVRLYLDLYTSKNFPQFIIVDDSIFNNFIEGIKKKGFKQFTLPRSRDISPKPKAIMVLKSEKGDKFQYFMYQ